MIGGLVSKEKLPADLIFAEGQQLTHQDKEALWKISQFIDLIYQPMT